MTPMPVSNFDLSNSDEELYVEVDPTGRYGRYKDLLGFGSFKKVYRAFDQERGIEVAWNQEKLRNFADDPERIEQLFSEVRLLKGLRCENIIRLYNVWTNVEERTLNFITEACTSGNLREYRLKHRHVSLIAIKKWCRQILKGLDYLHTRQPCIIHRDLNCSNIFVNGNTGQIKIGDLGLAILNGENRSRYSVQGTAEYMAPELYEEDYTELVDIYSFGLCVLEMVTLTIPYEECDHVVKIYKKVSEGVKPLAFDKVKDPEVKDFIEKCIGKPRDRPSASELLRDPFFHGLD